MNIIIETLNRLGGEFLNFAWPMLWQSSVLISILFALDFGLRKKVRPAVRYALWFVVLAKLILPPTIASPTNPRWWIHSSTPPPAKTKAIPFTVTYGDQIAPDFQMPPVNILTPPPAWSPSAFVLVSSATVSAVLFAWLLIRWRKVMRKISDAEITKDFHSLLDEVRQLAGLRSMIRLKLTEDSMSPAVCGLFHPVILLPQSLAKKLLREQLRAVLLHEAIHLRRGDVWLNCAQALLQIIYWWHPLLWLANARIRRVREEAVDDAVMLALRDGAEIYAPTLLEVAKFAFRRPLASLGLVGILESRSALRQRIERLMEFSAPRKAGLTIVSILGILAFSAVALPMGEAPEKTNAEIVSSANNFPSVATNAFDQKVAANQLVQSGKIFYETGRFEDAESNLNAALKLDPENQAAKYYLDLVEQSRRAPKSGGPKAAFPIITNVPGILENTNFRVALHALQQRTGIETLAEPEVVTTSGVGVNRMRTDISSPIIRTSSGKEKIFNQLNNIHIDQFGPFVATPLTVVIGKLRDQTKRFDSEKKGISFLLNGNSNTIQPAIDPNTGEPIHKINSQPVDMASIHVTIKLPLEHASLSNVLDAIVLNSDKPIQYSVRDYGIMFLPRNESPQMEMRTFRVDKATFGIALHNINPSIFDETNDIRKTSIVACDFFKSVGIDLSGPGRSVAFNERLSLLFVKATPQELETVEQAIDALNPASQVHIKARFVEVPKNFVVPESFSNVAANPMIGILSEANFRTVLRALEHQKNVETLAEPEAVTTSGRPLQMRATDLIGVLTNLAFEEISNTSAIVAQTGKFEIGPTLDVVPYVLTDGYTINLTAKPELFQFLGYDQTTNVVFATNSLGEKIQRPIASPCFRVQESKAVVNLWDNQTLVLGNLQNRFIGYTNGVPTSVKSKSFADVEKKSRRTDKKLLIFVTATIVDPAGNRVHSDDELSKFSAIPPQPQN